MSTLFLWKRLKTNPLLEEPPLFGERPPRFLDSKSICREFPGALRPAKPQVAVCLSQATYPSEFRLDWCVGSQCFDHSISCAQFQLRIRGYYEHDRRPPLREAMFLVTLPPVYQREMLLGCPGMVVLAHLLVAESRLYTHEVTEALELVSRAQAMLQLPEIAGVHAEGVQNAWPLQTALGRVDGLLAWLDTGRMPLSADIVLPHCREDLSWLGNSSLLQVLPARTRIFVYEKCGAGEDLAAVLSPLLEPHVQLILARLDDVADPATGLSARRDECTAYLSHVVTHFGDLGDLTFFLHGDPSDHTPFGLLNLVFRAVALGTLNQLDFAHLGAPRLVATYNPCQDDIYRRAVGREPGRLYTYCCSQFLVSKRRIMQRPLEQYLQMLQLVDGSVPDLCQRIGPSYEKYAGQRLSHCFFLEFMWHVVFGEPDELPLRADDTSLPLFLRLKAELLRAFHPVFAALVGSPPPRGKVETPEGFRKVGVQTKPNRIPKPTKGVLPAGLKVWIALTRLASVLISETTDDRMATCNLAQDAEKKRAF
ncbi:unnamed protein product [Effrenium voratum]|uniref:Uncharacterized protein n=1 Tax=Effrenium voratum TaxID=2562239 RepID=A0AA36J108_9DINO|nr:unnamed protein product [Effrenium voratum]